MPRHVTSARGGEADQANLSARLYVLIDEQLPKQIALSWVAEQASNHL